MITSFSIRLLKKKLHYGSQYFTLGGKIEVFFERFFTKKALINLYEKEMQRYNKNQNTSCVCCSNGGEGYPKEILKREWLAKTQMMQFEDTEFPGSVLYDDYMTSFYGDYMTLPPENKRMTHEFERIDFGPYKI